MRFFITALPRSRTYWTAQFLTEGAVTCHHDLLGEVGSLDEYDRLLGPDDGAAETLVPLLYKPFVQKYRDCKFLLIERDPVDVDRSIAASGFAVNVEGLAHRFNRAAMYIEANADTLRVRYEDMDARLAEIWRHCRGSDMPAGREAMAGTNLQRNVAQMVGEFNRERFGRLQCSSR